MASDNERLLGEGEGAEAAECEGENGGGREDGEEAAAVEAEEGGDGGGAVAELDWCEGGKGSE